LIRDRDQAFGLAYTRRSCRGHTRPSNHRTLAVAERSRRARDRINSTRMPRSHDRTRRGALARRSEELCRLLQPSADASIVGQACAGLSACAAGSVVALPVLGVYIINTSGFEFLRGTAIYSVASNRRPFVPQLSLILFRIFMCSGHRERLSLTHTWIPRLRLARQPD
jgi:hypothetical protein